VTKQDPPTAQDAVAFVADHHRAVLVTHRQSGGLQSSPVMVGLDDDDRIVISSRETAYKVRNLREDPRLILCVFTDRFFGPWRQIDGTAEIIGLPEAMDGLVSYYRRLQGEHDDWDEYRRAMENERRVLIRVLVEAVGPTRSG
jgi:PPOX class probable F420-dependent enzyme